MIIFVNQRFNKFCRFKYRPKIQVTKVKLTLYIFIM
jgi:hypothetical protein